MKTHCKQRSRFPLLRSLFPAVAAFFTAALTASASVTVQGWWHLDNAQPITDSSGNGRTFGSAYSTAPAAGGQVAALPINNGAGGPLDGTGYISSQCIRLGVGAGGAKRQSAMWGIGYNPPAQNFGIEIWVLPQDNGIAGGSGGWIFSSGQSGGVALRVNAPSGGGSYIDAFDVGNQLPIGDQVPLETNEWMELAIVNNGGVVTFYTNGVPCGPSVTNGTTASAGDVYIGSPGDNSAYDGYLDEARMFTFSAGAFTTNDLLLRPPGPNLLSNPASEVVWSGGAAPFNVVASFDFNSDPADAQTYQWLMNDARISGATNSFYSVPVATSALNSSNFEVAVSLRGITVTSAPPAVLTVVPNNASNVAAFQNDVRSTAGLVAYFPVDNCEGSVVSNVVDSAHDGALVGDAGYDGRTNRAFGQRALVFDGNAAVSIPNDSAYEFGSGAGTIEALVYLNSLAGADTPIFSEGPDGGPSFYSLSTDPTGSFLLYTNDAPTSLSWAVPGGLLGRMVDVALVFSDGTNVTAFINGQSLGTQTQTSFGSSAGGPLWLGSVGSLPAGGGWNGDIDELAIYGTSLPTSVLQDHYTKFVFGTNVVPPVITSQPVGKTVLAGGSPELTVTASGGLPLTYQWTSNGVPIPGADSPTLVLSNSTTASSATYAVTVTNVFGATNSQPIAMTFVQPPSGYATTVMHDHPVAFWRMADTNGPTAVDSAGLNDAVYSSSGVMYSVGGPSFDPSAAVAFDGNTGRAVTPANFPDLNPGGPFTIEFWARLTAYPSTHFYSPLSSMPRPSRTGGWEWYLDGNSPGYEFHTAEAGNYSLITADNNAPPADEWWYLTGIWDGTNLYLYVNGELGDDQIDPPAPAGTDNFATEGLGQTEFVPNTSVPLYIGCRSDGVDYFEGSLSDIAFYDYAFTYQQVTNHFAAAWIPAQVTVPTGVTNVENTTVTLSAVATGLPNTYQWYFNGSPLTADAQNADGTLHYPNGVTGTNLVITEVKPTADSGQYYIQVLNPAGGATSSHINVVITPNTNPPTVVSVTGLGTPPAASGNPAGQIPFVVKVVFSSRIDATAGATAANYSLSPSATILAATLPGNANEESLGADWREVLLDTSGLTPGQKYNLTISGLKDQSQTPVAMPTTVVSFVAPTVTAGVAEWDYYYLGSGNAGGGAPNDLDADYDFQFYASQTNAFITSLDTTPITTGDLNNNPAFAGIGDYYGDVISGWLTPPVTTNYTFFLAADDSAVFLLSSNALPSGLVQIADLPNYVGAFVETNSAGGGLPSQDSSPILLKGGQAYYFELIHEEITGGDFVKAAWRMQGDNTPAPSLSPIPGAYLSAYSKGAAPEFTGLSATNGNFILNWSGAGTLQESTNLFNWTDVPGAPASPFTLPIHSGTNALFFRLRY